MMEITVHPDGRLVWPGGVFRCALGRGGVRADKREGDGATPVGHFPLRRVLWRPDRLERPDTALPAAPIAPEDGWCDEPADPAYNRPVERPYPASHEALWREDGVYDVIVVLGHNDEPVVPGLGSAVFMHIVRPWFSEEVPGGDVSGGEADRGPPWEATAGCVALPLPDLLRLLKDCGPDTVLTVLDPQPAAG